MMRFSGLIAALRDIIYPPKCLACRRPVSSGPGLCIPCWHSLEFTSARHCLLCGESFKPLVFSREIEQHQVSNQRHHCPCRQAHWTKHLRGADDFFAPLYYGGVLPSLISQFKYSKRLALAPFFCRLIAQHLGPHLEAAQSGLIIPIPLHQNRLRSRGYNQAAILCLRLQKMFPHLTYAPNVIHRTRDNPRQAGLGNSARIRNVRGIFSINSQETKLLEGRQIFIVDDVITTGSTIGECANAIRRVCTPSAIQAIGIAKTTLHSDSWG